MVPAMGSERKRRLKTKQARYLYIKKAKKQVRIAFPWLTDLAENKDVVLDLAPLNSMADPMAQIPLKLHAPTGSLCPYCRGTRNLCGKEQCPVMLRFISIIKTQRYYNESKILGDSPPSIFIGRSGYPFVYAGPMVPPIKGDTGTMATPETWLESQTLNSIVDFRSALIRGKSRINVHYADPEKQSGRDGRLISNLQELAITEKAVETEMLLKHPPRPSITLSENVQPIGPSAPMRRFNTEPTVVNHLMERATNDSDMLSKTAITFLHKRKLPVSAIQRAFSAGCFGVIKNRKLVPTRWSITAVDSTLSLELLSKIRYFPLINDFEVYEANQLGNRFIVILLPTAWRYELVEAFFPGSAWNPGRHTVALCSDYEYYKGRTTYARIGGCYYASRLAITEHLTKRLRQGGAIVLREAYPQYLLPIG
ncbi:MAG: hypothetical protein ACTSVM_00050, partial [Candidatus Ranarchaeia archaeon]